MPNRIIFVKDKIGKGRMDGNYIGWHAEVNKKKKLVKNMPKNTFYIYDDGNKERMDRVLRHEEIENFLMTQKGWSYNRDKKVKGAHGVANELEDNTDLLVKVKASPRARATTRKVVRRTF